MVGDVLSHSTYRDNQHHLVGAVSTEIVQGQERQHAAAQPDGMDREAANDEMYVIDADSGLCRVIDDATGDLDPAPDRNMLSPAVQHASRTPTRPEKTPAQAQSTEIQGRSRRRRGSATGELHWAAKHTDRDARCVAPGREI